MAILENVKNVQLDYLFAMEFAKILKSLGVYRRLRVETAIIVHWTMNYMEDNALKKFQDVKDIDQPENVKDVMKIMIFNTVYAFPGSLLILDVMNLLFSLKMDNAKFLIVISFSILAVLHVILNSDFFLMGHAEEELLKDVNLMNLMVTVKNANNLSINYIKELVSRLDVSNPAMMENVKNAIETEVFI